MHNILLHDPVVIKRQGDLISRLFSTSAKRAFDLTEGKLEILVA